MAGLDYIRFFLLLEGLLEPSLVTSFEAGLASDEVGLVGDLVMAKNIDFLWVLIPIGLVSYIFHFWQ